MEPTRLPKWALIISGIFALLELAVSISLWVSPAAMLDTVDYQAKGVDFLIEIWASRQFALGFVFGFATIRKSAPMLTIAYIFFAVMMIGDLLIGIRQNEMSMIIASLVMCA
ncbi:MAG TPA: hypothetical protein VF145_10900, partial [Chitinophagaceae bacterium]